MTGSPDPILAALLQALATHRRITFVLADLDDHCGKANLDSAVVYLADANTIGEMRATVLHELMHLICPECPEDEVEAQAAEMLVPLAAALAAQACGDFAGAAEMLVVDSALVRARLRVEQRTLGREKAG